MNNNADIAEMNDRQKFSRNDSWTYITEMNDKQYIIEMNDKKYKAEMNNKQGLENEQH